MIPKGDAAQVEPLSCDNHNAAKYSDAAIVVPSREIVILRKGSVSEERVHVAPKSFDIHTPSLPLIVAPSSLSLRATIR